MKEKGNEVIEAACPQGVINYTRHMGAVDVSDQKREWWWKFVFHFVLNVCLENRFVCFNCDKHSPLYRSRN
jgi:hypothetical protein